MRSLCFIACLLCLSLVAGITNARKDQGEYWKNGDRDNTSVESSNLKVEIEPTHVPIVDGLKPDDNIQSRDEKSFVYVYGANGNIKSRDEKSFVYVYGANDNIKSRDEKSFVYVYGDNGNIKSRDEKSFVYVYGANDNIKSRDEKSFVRRPSVEADVDNQKLGTNDVNVYVE